MIKVHSNGGGGEVLLYTVCLDLLQTLQLLTCQKIHKYAACFKNHFPKFLTNFSVFRKNWETFAFLCATYQRLGN